MARASSSSIAGFGDPETQVILPRMKSNLLPLLEATINGKIDNCAIEWDERAAVTVVLASAVTPTNMKRGRRFPVWTRRRSLMTFTFFTRERSARTAIVTLAAGFSRDRAWIDNRKLRVLALYEAVRAFILRNCITAGILLSRPVTDNIDMSH